MDQPTHLDRLMLAGRIRGSVGTMQADGGPSPDARQWTLVGTIGGVVNTLENTGETVDLDAFKATVTGTLAEIDADTYTATITEINAIAW